MRNFILITGIVLAIGKTGRNAGKIKGEFDYPITKFSNRTSKRIFWANASLCYRRAAKVKECPCGNILPKGNNTFCDLCSLIPKEKGLPIIAPKNIKLIDGDELKRLCFCNSDKLLNMVIQTNKGDICDW